MAEERKSILYRKDTIRILLSYLSRIDSTDEKLSNCADVYYTGAQVPFYSIMEKRNEQVNLCLRFIRKECGIEIPYVRIHQFDVCKTVSQIEAVRDSIEAAIARDLESVAK